MKKNRHTGQWNDMELRNRSTQIYPNCFFTTIQKQFNGGKIIFSTNGAGTIGYPEVKTKTKAKTQTKLNLNIKFYTQINTK